MGRRSLVLIWLTAVLVAPAGTSAAEVARERRIEVVLAPADGRVEVREEIEIGTGGPVGFCMNEGLTRPRAKVGDQAVELAGADGGWRLRQPLLTGTILTLDYAFELEAEPKADGPFLGPAGGFLPGWSGWLADFGDGRWAFDLSIEIPLPDVAVATGNLLEESRQDGVYRARFRAEHAGEPPSIFSGPYLIDDREAGDVRYRTYFTATTRRLADLYLERAADYVGRFEERIGDYPYAGFAVVAAPVPVGLGFAGLTYVSGRILPLPFMQTRSLAHEVLHSWFGNAIEVDYGSGNWAEGLTTYLADYGILDDPAERRAMRLGWLRDYNALPPQRDIVLEDFVAKGHDADQVVGYNKVAFVFHMLRRRLGDTAFAAGLQRFYDRHRFTRASWRDLQASFEAVSAQDLERFFAQWLTRPGAPALELDEASSRQVDGAYQVGLAIDQSAPFYDLIVPVEIATAEETRRFAVRIDDGRSVVTLETQHRPLSLAVDPEFDVFRQLAPGEAPPILRDVLLDPSTRTVVLADDEQGRSAARALAEALLGEVVEVVDRDAAAGVPDDLPLLVIGTGEEMARALTGLGIAPPPPEVQGSGTASVWTASRYPQAPVLVIRADDADALRALSRPLPHYRRDSWLVFDGDTLIARGLWPAGRSPLSTDLG